MILSRHYCQYFKLSCFLHHSMLLEVSCEAWNRVPGTWAFRVHIVVSWSPLWDKLGLDVRLSLLVEEKMAVIPAFQWIFLISSAHCLLPHFYNIKPWRGVPSKSTIEQFSKIFIFLVLETLSPIFFGHRVRLWTNLEANLRYLRVWNDKLDVTNLPSLHVTHWRAFKNALQQCLSANQVQDTTKFILLAENLQSASVHHVCGFSSLFWTSRNVSCGLEE